MVEGGLDSGHVGPLHSGIATTLCCLFAKPQEMSPSRSWVRSILGFSWNSLGRQPRFLGGVLLQGTMRAEARLLRERETHVAQLGRRLVKAQRLRGRCLPPPHYSPSRVPGVLTRWPCGPHTSSWLPSLAQSGGRPWILSFLRSQPGKQSPGSFQQVRTHCLSLPAQLPTLLCSGDTATRPCLALASWMTEMEWTTQCCGSKPMATMGPTLLQVVLGVWRRIINKIESLPSCVRN